eukprot:751254-Hanusia_phi.AAC.6
MDLQINDYLSSFTLMQFYQLSALGDQELAGIKSVVNSAFSRKIMSVDDAGDRNKHAFREYHHDSMKKVKVIISGCTFLPECSLSLLLLRTSGTMPTLYATTTSRALPAGERATAKHKYLTRFPLLLWSFDRGMLA